MPPRFAYWTILIDGKPTAFRAREQQELLPTLAQLKRKNTDVEIKWFAQGKLWESPEAQRSTGRPAFTGEKRGGDWRPGGAHKDPRDRFKKKNRPERAWSEKDPATQRDRDKLAGPPRGDRPWSSKPPGGEKRPWSGKPRGDKPGGFRPAGGERKPWTNKPAGGPPRGDRPWRDKPAGAGPRGDRPWQTKPTGPRSERKPWSGKPAGGPPRGDRPWSGKPRGDKPGGFRPAGGKRPWSPKPGGTTEARKRRDDEPPDRG